MTAAEEWRAVVGYEGWYEVSSLGNIRSVERTVGVPASDRNAAHERTFASRKLKLNASRSHGYLSITLHAAGVAVEHLVHALVCAAYHGPRPDGYDVAHFDGNRSNNAAANLRYATRRQNLADGARNGKSLAGERHGNAKLTNKDIVLIRSSALTTRELSSLFGMTAASIRKIRRRDSWKHIAD